MNYLKKRLALAGFLLCFSGVSHAHDAAAVLGNPENFLGMATVDCFADPDFGGDDTDHLVAQIRDLSPQKEGVSVSVHIFRYNRRDAMNVVTDPISGDADWSPAVVVRGGNGTYGMIVSKTGEGERNFQLVYHCLAKNGSTHTGTDTAILQFGQPLIGQ